MRPHHAFLPDRHCRRRSPAAGRRRFRSTSSTAVTRPAARCRPAWSSRSTSTAHVVGALGMLGPAASAGLLRLTQRGRHSSSPPSWNWPSSTGRGAGPIRRSSASSGPRSPRTSSTTRLTAIESFVRTDPERARELLIGFADFTRYSFRSHGQFVTMAEELRLVDTYLDLERARFGDRLPVTLRVAPEVLGRRCCRRSSCNRWSRTRFVTASSPSERTGQLSIVIADADTEAVVERRGRRRRRRPGYLRPRPRRHAPGAAGSASTTSTSGSGPCSARSTA